MDQCEVCDLPFHSRQDIEDRMEMGFELDELDQWVQGRFNFEISRASLAKHKHHQFLAELHRFIPHTRPRPLLAEERKAMIDATFKPDIREASRKMKLTTEDDTQA